MSKRQNMYILECDNKGIYKKSVNGYMINKYTFTAKQNNRWYYYDVLSGVLLKDNSGKYAIPCEKTMNDAINNYNNNGGAWCCREIRTSPDYRNMVMRFQKLLTITKILQNQ